MTEPIYIDPATDQGRRLTAAALLAARDAKHAASFRCSVPRCGRVLARVGLTSAGPLFTSSWEVETPIGFAVKVNGRKLSRREALAFRDRTRPVLERSGPKITETTVDGVVAHLALPAGIDDYPPLLVRCPRHGDAVIPLDLARAALRRKPGLVTVSKPFTAYAFHDPEGSWLPDAPSTRSTERRAYDASSTTAD